MCAALKTAVPLDNVLSFYFAFFNSNDRAAGSLEKSAAEGKRHKFIASECQFVVKETRQEYPQGCIRP